MADEDEGGTTEAATVSKEIYGRIVTAKQGLEGKVAEMQTTIDALTEKAATADTLAGEVAAYKDKLTESDGKFNRFKAISTELGTTDPDAIEAVEWRYGKLPSEDRPELQAWLGALKADPSKAPSVLRPFLPSGQDDTPPPDVKPKPKPRGGNGEHGGGGATVTNSQVVAAREHAATTGDWGPYKTLRKAWGAKTR